MKATLNHVALNINAADFDWYRNFFETVCEMDTYQFRGETPNRQAWLTGGIQLNECTVTHEPIAMMDHFCFHCEDVYGLVDQAIAAGCSPIEGKRHWFRLPNGVQVEVKNYNV